MTEEEFREELITLMAWISKRERPPSQWYLSAQEYFGMRFSEAYRKEHGGR